MRIPTVTDAIAEKVFDNAVSPVAVEFTCLGEEQARSRRILELVAEEFDDRIIFLRIFQEENPEFARMWFVKECPTVIIVRRRAEVWRLQGVVSMDALRSRFEIEADRGRL